MRPPFADRYITHFMDADSIVIFMDTLNPIGKPLATKMGVQLFMRTRSGTLYFVLPTGLGTGTSYRYSELHAGEIYLHLHGIAWRLRMKV